MCKVGSDSPLESRLMPILRGWCSHNGGCTHSLQLNHAVAWESGICIPWLIPNPLSPLLLCSALFLDLKMACALMYQVAPCWAIITFIPHSHRVIQHGIRHFGTTQPCQPRYPIWSLVLMPPCLKGTIRTSLYNFLYKLYIQLSFGWQNFRKDPCFGTVLAIEVPWPTHRMWLRTRF